MDSHSNCADVLEIELYLFEIKDCMNIVNEAFACSHRTLNSIAGDFAVKPVVIAL